MVDYRLHAITWKNVIDYDYKLQLPHVWFEPHLGQTKDYKISICCFPTKHAALKRKSNDWSTWNQDNVSKWHNMSIRILL
jgi:hypothetical protein